METKTKKSKESSKLKTIDDVSKKYTTKKSLGEEVKSLRAVVGAQEAENKRILAILEEKNAEIEHLKSLLAKSVPKLGDSGLINPDNEDMIAEMQLQKLKRTAQERELTLEEARKFEIFSKVKQNSQKQRPVEAKFSKLPENMQKSKLLEIAEGKKSE